MIPDNFVEDNTVLRGIPEDLRKYIRCFNIDLSDGFKLYVTVGNELSLKAVKGKHVLSDNLMRGKLTVKITKDAGFCIELGQEFEGLLDAIELIGKVPERVISGLDLTETDRRVIVDISGINDLDRFVKYRRIRERLGKSTPRVKIGLLSVLKSISENTSEISEDVRKKINELASKLEGRRNRSRADRELDIAELDRRIEQVEEIIEREKQQKLNKAIL